MVVTFLRERRLHTSPHHQGGWGPVGHSSFFFFLDSHLLSTYCILCVRFYLSSSLTITEAAWRAIHAHQGRLSRKRLPRATQRKALQISSCVLYILGPWESQVTKETSKSLKIKAYFYFWYLAIPAFSGLGLGGGCLSSACVRNLRFPESLWVYIQTSGFKTQKLEIVTWICNPSI